MIKIKTFKKNLQKLDALTLLNMLVGGCVPRGGGWMCLDAFSLHYQKQISSDIDMIRPKKI